MARNEDAIVYPLRLFREHDADILSLIGTTQLSYPKAVYACLKAFVQGNRFTMEIPPNRESPLEKKSRKYRWNLYLDPEKDKDVIGFLNKFNDGYKNCFIKNLFRLYICFPASNEFFVSEQDANEVYQSLSVFRELRNTGKEIVSESLPIKETPIVEAPKEVVKKPVVEKAAPQPEKEEPKNEMNSFFEKKEEVVEEKKADNTLSKEESDDLTKMLDML